ncbi:Pentatricopeptide repeat-containing protein [Acorus gramineus]|uniref:Pentatricopeptide repeat-containing protein n=2 Tax=Acorus gramineus TaxID=55184 RepID=A0AAV8ZZB1_ACOGR|nr:Pentatricopeptide repeat-containing protein [Acorus gramineus]
MHNTNKSKMGRITTTPPRSPFTSPKPLLLSSSSPQTPTHPSPPSDPPPPSLPTIRPSPLADSLSRLLITHHNPFHASESPLQLLGLSLPTQTLTQTLLRLRHSSKIALAFFTWSRDHLRLPPDPDAYDLIVDSLGRVRQFDAAWTLIADMDRRGLPPSPRTFHVLIRRLVAAGMTRQAVRAFDDMETFIERPPTKAEFTRLLDTLCKYRHVRLAMELFNARRSVFEPDVKAYTVVIYGWCKIGRFDFAEKLFEEMLARGLEPSVVTYNVLLNGICRNSKLHPSSVFDRTVGRVDDVFVRMRDRGVQPDVTSYSIVLNLYSRAHKAELTLSKLNSMRDDGISPNVAMYTLVVKCLCSCGRLDEAEGLLEEMVVNGVRPMAVTHNCFFKAYGGRDDHESALKLYRMVRDGDGVDAHSYNVLVGLFLRLGCGDAVGEVWADMVEKGMGPDLDSYTVMVHGLCERRKWREACRFFVEMIERGFLPQKVTFETLYRGLIQSGLLRTWWRLKRRLEEESMTFGAEFEEYHLKPYRR